MHTSQKNKVKKHVPDPDLCSRAVGMYPGEDWGGELSTELSDTSPSSEGKGWRCRGEEVKLVKDACCRCWVAALSGTLPCCCFSPAITISRSPLSTSVMADPSLSSSDKSSSAPNTVIAISSLPPVQAKQQQKYLSFLASLLSVYKYYGLYIMVKLIPKVAGWWVEVNIPQY